MEKINQVDWRDAASDVGVFLGPQELRSLTLWNKKFFLHKVSLLSEAVKRRKNL